MSTHLLEDQEYKISVDPAPEAPEEDIRLHREDTPAPGDLAGWHIAGSCAEAGVPWKIPTEPHNLVEP